SDSTGTGSCHPTGAAGVAEAGGLVARTSGARRVNAMASDRISFFIAELLLPRRRASAAGTPTHWVPPQKGSRNVQPAPARRAGSGWALGVPAHEVVHNVHNIGAGLVPNSIVAAHVEPVAHDEAR